MNRYQIAVELYRSQVKLDLAEHQRALDVLHAKRASKERFEQEYAKGKSTLDATHKKYDMPWVDATFILYIVAMLLPFVFGGLLMVCDAAK